MNSLVAGYCSVYSLKLLILLNNIAYIYGMKWAQLYKINADARKLCSYEMWLNDGRITSQILYLLHRN
jgi:hypothetical protein